MDFEKRLQWIDEIINFPTLQRQRARVIAIAKDLPESVRTKENGLKLNDQGVPEFLVAYDRVCALAREELAYRKQIAATALDIPVSGPSLGRIKEIVQILVEKIQSTENDANFYRAMNKDLEAAGHTQEAAILADIFHGLLEESAMVIGALAVFEDTTAHMHTEGIQSGTQFFDEHQSAVGALLKDMRQRITTIEASRA